MPVQCRCAIGGGAWGPGLVGRFGSGLVLSVRSVCLYVCLSVGLSVCLPDACIEATDRLRRKSPATVIANDDADDDDDDNHNYRPRFDIVL